MTKDAMFGYHLEAHMKSNFLKKDIKAESHNLERKQGIQLHGTVFVWKWRSLFALQDKAQSRKCSMRLPPQKCERPVRNLVT